MISGVCFRVTIKNAEIINWMIKRFFFFLFRVVWLCTILSVTECLFSLINTIIKCVAWIERKNGKDGKKMGVPHLWNHLGLAHACPRASSPSAPSPSVMCVNVGCRRRCWTRWRHTSHTHAHKLVVQCRHRHDTTRARSVKSPTEK